MVDIPSVFAAGGLVALAELTTIAERTARIGSASWLDIFVVAPGIHLHQKSPELANGGGELPPTAALTSGYVFRVENQAMVGWLQSVGKTGNLVNVRVEKAKVTSNGFFMSNGGPLSAIVYLFAPLLTVTTQVVLAYYKEWWTFGVIGVLMLARAINVALIRRRSRSNWKGASEPGVLGDLLILLSQDRWIRMKGEVDDLKAVTSGQWLEDMTRVESYAAAAATLLVYVTVAFSVNASMFGNVMLMGLLLLDAGLLGLSNGLVRGLRLNQVVTRVVGEPKPYKRRLDLAMELIAETKRRDWAVGLGMVRPRVEEASEGVQRVELGN